MVGTYDILIGSTRTPVVLYLDDVNSRASSVGAYSEWGEWERGQLLRRWDPLSMHDYLNLEVERVEVGGLVEEREILQIGVPSHCAFVSHVRAIRVIQACQTHNDREQCLSTDSGENRAPLPYAPPTEVLCNLTEPSICWSHTRITTPKDENDSISRSKVSLTIVRNARARMVLSFNVLMK